MPLAGIGRSRRNRLLRAVFRRCLIKMPALSGRRKHCLCAVQQKAQGETGRAEHGKGLADMQQAGPRASSGQETDPADKEARKGCNAPGQTFDKMVHPRGSRAECRSSVSTFFKCFPVYHTRIAFARSLPCWQQSNELSRFPGALQHLQGFGRLRVQIVPVRFNTNASGVTDFF
jgi:hypothetical protein